jgi:proteic killer suppression protein
MIDRPREGDYTEKWMEVRFRDPCYDQLEVDPHYSGGWPPAVVKAYRSRLNYIRQAQDERDLYSWRSLRMEKLQGSRQHQHSLRLNDQWRLVIEFEGNSPKKTIVIVNIEDYH